MTLRTASNEGSSNDAEWGTPGWRWRRKLCLTERTQQCQSGPTTKAWFHDRCNRVDSDACRGSNVTTRVRNTVRALARSSTRNRRETLVGEATLRRVRGTVWARAESTARAAGESVAREGGTARARAGCTARTRSTREWTALFLRTWQTTELQRQETCGQHRLGTRRWQRQSECGWHRQAASSGRVRVVLPGSDTWTSADSTIEAGPSFRSCTASPEQRRVSRYQA